MPEHVLRREADIAALDMTPDVESSRVDPASKRELLGEPVMMDADQLRGIWLDSLGHCYSLCHRCVFEETEGNFGQG